MGSIAFTGVSKVYPDGTRAVRDLNLDIADGEFMVLVGPSGCGKTTAMRMVAGLESITEGELRIGDAEVSNLDPQRRDVAMVFQNYALYPHMSIFENIAFPLRSTRVAKDDVRRRVERVASTLGLSEHLRRKPRNLSGGQRQRVAMARAIVREPQAFLMDEPLSNLDAKLRAQMRAEIAALQRQLGVTTMYVTHDQVEAMTMGDRIAVLRDGAIQQLGTAEELYERPVNLFVASFLGSPPMNMLRCRFYERDGTSMCNVGDQHLVVPRVLRSQLGRADQLRGAEFALGVRPEHFSETADTASLRIRVEQVENLGSQALVHGTVEAEAVVTDDVLDIARDTDAAVAETFVRQAQKNRTPIVAALAHHSRPRAGDELALAVDLTRACVFDLETGSRLTAQPTLATSG